MARKKNIDGDDFTHNETHKNREQLFEEDFSLDDNFDDDINDLDEIEYDEIPELRVGVVGYSEGDFDEVEAKVALENILDDLESEYITNGSFGSINIISGGTNQGIPKLAYEIASERGLLTVAIIPEQARSHELYDVDEIIWVGEKFGDESETFIDSIDVLVKIGGGDQSNNEAKMAEEKEIPVHEFDL